MFVQRTLFRLVMCLLALSPSPVFAQEISLFDSSGNAAAYISAPEKLTIYLWSGEPVAYLDAASTGVVHVYGFNGKHLGWFENGIVLDSSGNAACVTKDAMSGTNYEPYKSYKQYKPYKSYKEYAPYKPHFSQRWSNLPCIIALGLGAN